MKLWQTGEAWLYVDCLDGKSPATYFLCYGVHTILHTLDSNVKNTYTNALFEDELILTGRMSA